MLFSARVADRSRKNRNIFAGRCDSDSYGSGYTTAMGLKDDKNNPKSFGEIKIISIFANPNQERYFSRGGKTMPM